MNNNFKIGEVWYVKFPYGENNGDFKDRPAIIVGIKKDNITVIKCTSKSKKRSNFDYTLKNPNKANLNKNGNIRCNKIAIINIKKDNIRKKIGELDSEDLTSIINLYKQSINDKKAEYSIKESIILSELSDALDESTAMAAINPVIGLNHAFLIQYGYPKSSPFADEEEVDSYAISNDIITKNILNLDRETFKVKKEDFSFLEDRDIAIYKYIGKKKDGFKNIIESIGQTKYRQYFYEELTGKKLLSDDQIECDTECFKLIDPRKIMNETNSIIQTIIDEYKSIIGEEVPKIPLMNDYDIKKANNIIRENVNIEIFENQHGYFAENAINRKRTGYCSKIEDITIDSIL